MLIRNASKLKASRSGGMFSKDTSGFVKANPITQIIRENEI
jgi:hypothetical protein